MTVGPDGSLWFAESSANQIGRFMPPCVISFSDVLPGAYFAAPVHDLACQGALAGYADGTFRPYTRPPAPNW